MAGKRSVAPLDALIATITVDSYTDSEAETAFLTVIEQEVAVPVGATLLGQIVIVTVLGFDLRGHDSRLAVRCRRDADEARVDYDSLVFEPGSVAAWIQAAHRRSHGLSPHSAVPPAEWHGLDWMV